MPFYHDPDRGEYDPYRREVIYAVPRRRERGYDGPGYPSTMVDPSTQPVEEPEEVA
jgi:hypothetical protein